MSNFKRTISYLKRNGIKDTCSTIMERLDKKNIEQIQREAQNYSGGKLIPLKADNDLLLHRRQRRKRFEKEYVFSIVVPTYETDPLFLLEMIDSVMNQSYGKVELIIADASESNIVEGVAKAYEKDSLRCIYEENVRFHVPYAGEYPRMKYIRLAKNEGIAANTNRALELAEGDYVGLLDHDDVLTYDALYEVMQKLQEKPWRMIYSDEGKADYKMESFFEPNIKPRFNFDLLLTNNYICHFLVLEKNLIQRLGFRKEYDGAQDFDLVLRAVAEIGKDTGGCHLCGNEIAHIDKVLYHWRCHESSTAADPESKRYAYEAGKRALEDFIRQADIKGKVSHSKHLGFYHIDYEDSIWKSRPEIGAVCGRVMEGKKVTAGPVLDGRVLFRGLKKNYSGYLNRADFSMEVDVMDERAAKFSPKYEEAFARMEKEGQVLSFKEKCDYVKKHNDIFVYVPDFSK